MTLNEKTQHLKWLKQLKAEASQRAARVQPQPSPCDCKAWLKKKVSQNKPRKPVLPPSAPKLVLLASAAPKNARHHAYNLAFEQGTAAWYHIPFEALPYDEETILNIGYVAIGATKPGTAERCATHLWRVLSVQLMPRHMLTVEQSGALKASEALYWLFELGESVMLAQSISGFRPPFCAVIVSQADFMHLKTLDEVA